MEKFPEKIDFFWLGNQPAIDFNNTLVVESGEEIDLLQSSGDVLAWAAQSGLFKASVAPCNVLDEARRYRAQLHQAIQRIAQGSRLPAALLAPTNAYLARPAACEQLRVKGDAYTLAPQFNPELAADFMVPLAKSFAQLLTTADLARLRKCANPDCVLFFYDTSKNGKRTWCSLDICGNKYRMAASRARRALSS